ncbi:MAG: hypothetical protein WBE76_05845 [Terracidiphilus sp.]
MRPAQRRMGHDEPHIERGWIDIAVGIFALPRLLAGFLRSSSAFDAGWKHRPGLPGELPARCLRRECCAIHHAKNDQRG